LVALEGSTSTYYEFNPYTGQLDFGFSADLWRTTNDYIDAQNAARKEIGDPSSLLAYGFQVFTIYEGIGRHGIYGLLPELAAIDSSSVRARAIASMSKDLKAEYEGLLAAGASQQSALFSLLNDASQFADDAMEGRDLFPSQESQIAWANQFIKELFYLGLPIVLQHQIPIHY
jgi:hypothetical protein